MVRAGNPRNEQGPKVVVIGAGMVGMCAALHLQRAGARVVIIDRRPPGEGDSYANGSVVSDVHVVPIATPSVLTKVPAMLLDSESPLAVRWSYLPRLAPWLARFIASARPAAVRRITEALAVLMDGCMDAFDPLLTEAGEPGMLRRTGSLVLYESKRAYRADARARALEQHVGRRFEVYSPSALRQVEPALGTTDRLYAGVYYPRSGYVTDNYRLVQILARRFRNGGGRVLRETVNGFAFDGTHISAVRTDRGTHACDHVVVAAGAWSRPLARDLGCNPPLDTERGYSLTLPDTAVQPRMPVFSAAGGMVCTPRNHGLRLAGTDELGGLDLPPDWRRADLLLRHAQRLFPALDGPAAGHWMGFRPSMPDSLPVISRTPRHPNAFLAFGHGHCGLMLGPRTGELVRDLVFDRPPVVDPTPYRVDRF
jgi:D-amino-acid dehydrogenase